MIVVTELNDNDADVSAWYVNGIKVYDYHDPYIDELLQSIFSHPEFRDVKFEIRNDGEVDEESHLPSVIE